MKPEDIAKLTDNPHLNTDYLARLQELYATGTAERERIGRWLGERECQSTRYDPRPCEGPARFDVVYRVGQPRREHDRHPACFRHGLAEVDAHHTADGMSECELVEA